MGVNASLKTPQYAGPVVSTASATPQQSTAVERARRDNELASLSGLEKLHRQHQYEADDLKLTGALYTQYIYNKDQAAQKDEAAALAKKIAQLLQTHRTRRKTLLQKQLNNIAVRLLI